MYKKFADGKVNASEIRNQKSFIKSNSSTLNLSEHELKICAYKQAMRRTGEVQAPIESFFWNRIIADESHVLKSMTTSKLNLFFSSLYISLHCITATF